MGEHSLVGASSMGRWGNCTMSPSLISTLPPSLQNRSSRPAEQGSAAHRLADLGVQQIVALGDGRRDVLMVPLVGTVLAKFKDRDDWEAVGEDPFSGAMLADTSEVLLGFDYNVFTCDDEMEEGVRFYLETVIEAIEECQGVAEVRPETRCFPVAGDDRVFGTSDCVVFDPASGNVWVLDFKYGRMLVSAIDNPQAMFYAAGSIEEFPTHGGAKVTLVIVQPRGEFADGRRVSDCQYTVSQILTWVEDVLKVAVEATQIPALAEYKVGSWCQYCPAAAMCPLMQKEALRTAQEAFAEDLETLSFDEVSDVEMILPDHSDPDQLAAALKVGKVLTIWTKRVQEMADHAAKSQPIPGFKLVRSVRRRRWVSDEDVVFKLQAEGKYDEGVNVSPKSPAQMEKSEALTPEQIKQLSIKPEGKLTLVPESARGKAVDPAIAAFSEI